MIKTGLCSVTFKNKSAEEIIELTAKAGLNGIEWISNAHVHEGDVALARNVGEMTRAAGLDVIAYGSLFTLGTGSDIIPYLESAVALGTREMRIWAGGGKPSGAYSKEVRQAIVGEAKEISNIAAHYGVSLSTECHSNSLTDCEKSQLLFMSEVSEPNFRTYWQELLTFTQEENMHSLTSVYNSGKLTNLHIYQYDITEAGRCRQLLSDGFTKWSERFMLFKNDNTPRYALLEFVKNNSEDSFFADARTLRTLTMCVNSVQVQHFPCFKT